MGATWNTSHTIRSVHLAELIDLSIFLVNLLLLFLDCSREGLYAMLQVRNGLLRLNALAAHGLLEVRVFFLQVLVGASSAPRLLSRCLGFENELLQEKSHSSTIVVKAFKESRAHLLMAECVRRRRVFGEDRLEGILERFFGR